MTIWAGSEESYEVYIQAQASVKALAADMLACGGDMPDMPKAWTKQGNLAVINMQGSLINGSAGWMSLFGVTGYDDFTSALTEAALDPEIKSMLVDVGSGGGHASGAQPAADYLEQIKKIKPVHAHISTVGASAAYWVASAASSLSIDPMAVTGSIGAVKIHTSIAKAEAARGIDRTVIRSGDHKMSGNPYEPLSDLGKAEMQAQVNDVSAMFEEHVAKMRGVSAADVRADMGQGRTFLGKRAVSAGLVDKVQTRDQAVAAAKKN